MVADAEMLPRAAILFGVVGKAAVTFTTMPGVNVVVVVVAVVVVAFNDPLAAAEPIKALEVEMLAVVALPKGTVPVVE